MSYDREDLLTNYVEGPTSAAILYNGDGQRVRKMVVGGMTTYYFVDDSNPTGFEQVLERYSASGNNTPSPTPDIFQIWGHGLIAVGMPFDSLYNAPRVEFPVVDGHGSVRSVVDGSGTYQDDDVYDAYGVRLDGSALGSTTLLARYSGEEYDPTLKMQYLRARWYRPAVGRFATMDTFEGQQSDPLSLHRYLYAHGNPVNNSDPSGQAVYFVKRALGIEQGGRAWAAGAGHGFLLFTDPTDEGKADPFTTGQRILATYSWHPNVWDYQKSQGDERGVPGRVWESHPGDLHPPSRMYTPLLVTANHGQQMAVFNYVQSWMESAPIGYELGAPKQDPEHYSNEIGSEQSVPARAAGVYYSLREQNCVWWATVMILQSGAKVNQGILSDIAAFNHGEGAASDVIAGRRSASDVRTLSSVPFGRFTIQPALKIDLLQIGIAP